MRTENPPLRYEGGCHCGAIRYAAEDVFMAGYCHCSVCRRISGAPAAAFVHVPQPAFRVLQGQALPYASSDHFVRWFCGRCGTHLYGIDDQPVAPQVGFRLVSIMLGTLDEPDRVSPQLHQWWNARTAWFESADALPRFETGTLPHPSLLKPT